MAAHHTWSKTSLERRKTLHPLLQELVDEVLLLCPLDVTIIEGHRSKEKQLEAFNAGVSEVKVGKHNTMPSEAMDIAPLINGKIEWHNKALWRFFAGFVIGIAAAKEIPLRSGIDWDNDFDTQEHSLFDGPHFELIL